MKRCALTIAAGPKYWPSVQNTGQRRGARGAQDALGGVVEALAVLGATACAPCRARRPVVTRNGMDLAVRLEERLHVDDEVLLERQALDGLDVIGCAMSRSLIRVLQARRLRPLIRIASEPQMPWAHERRKVSEPSSSHLILCRASSTRSVRVISTSKSSQRGSASTSGSKRRMMKVTVNVGESRPGRSRGESSRTAWSCHQYFRSIGW